MHSWASRAKFWGKRSEKLSRDSVTKLSVTLQATLKTLTKETLMNSFFQLSLNILEVLSKQSIWFHSEKVCSVKQEVRYMYTHSQLYWKRETLFWMTHLKRVRTYLSLLSKVVLWWKRESEESATPTQKMRVLTLICNLSNKICKMETLKNWNWKISLSRPLSKWKLSWENKIKDKKLTCLFSRSTNCSYSDRKRYSFIWTS